MIPCLTLSASVRLNKIRGMGCKTQTPVQKHAFLGDGEKQRSGRDISYRTAKLQKKCVSGGFEDVFSSFFRFSAAGKRKNVSLFPSFTMLDYAFSTNDDKIASSQSCRARFYASPTKPSDHKARLASKGRNTQI